MKKLFAGFMLLLAAIIMVSCHNPNGRTTAKRTVIDGKVTNLKAFPDSKEFTLEVMDFGGNPTTYKGTINKDGTFKIYFDQYIAQDVQLTPIVRTFIAHPGDSIHIDIDYKAIGDVVFSGDGEKTNTDINHYISEYYSNYDKGNNDDLFFKTLDTASYRAVCENLKVTMLKKRTEFIDKYQPNDEVKKWTKNFITLNYYISLLNFNGYYNYVNQNKVPRVAPIELKGHDITKDDASEIFNATLLNADSYKLIRLFGMTSREITTKEVYKNPIVKQMFAAYPFYMKLNVNDAEYFDKFRGKLETRVQAAFIKQPLLKYYAAVKKNLANPKIVSDAILKNTTGTAANIIDSIKSENKGKVIYVDFWATWCGPCKAELPYSKKLMEKYKGKDIAFVFVCINSPKDTWKLNLADLKLAGRHYFCDQKQSAGVRQGFNIAGIPYYMMINKKGDITETGNLVRPSDPLTAHKMDKLLN